MTEPGRVRTVDEGDFHPIDGSDDHNGDLCDCETPEVHKGRVASCPDCYFDPPNHAEECPKWAPERREYEQGMSPPARSTS